MLARSLGVTQLVVVFNKMEKVDYDESRYYQIHDIIMPFLTGIGFKSEDIHCLPISAIQNENVTVTAKDERLLSWYGSDQDCLI